MFQNLEKTITEAVLKTEVPADRIEALQPLIAFIKQKSANGMVSNINFICTHNSRRSHLSQIWAQAAANYYGVKDVECYSGGTEATALFPKVAETLEKQGFLVEKISNGDNPVYMIKFDLNSPPVIGFSKKYSHSYNPGNGFAAVMTCNQADGACPFIPGAERRIPIKFDDPKVSDGTPEQDAVYYERSIQIAAEMFYVFSKIKS